MIGNADALASGVRPLNLLFRECDEETAIAAACDYAQSIKDLAASNIFAGDICSLKNFKLTRRGRVVFYDYHRRALFADRLQFPRPAAIPQR